MSLIDEGGAIVEKFIERIAAKVTVNEGFTANEEFAFETRLAEVIYLGVTRKDVKNHHINIIA